MSNEGTSPNRAYSGFGATHLHPNSPAGNFRYARNVSEMPAVALKRFKTENEIK